MPDESKEIIGHSKALMFALREIRRSTSQGGRRNILFKGETGTGKGLFAWYAHRQRAGDKELPFFTVNCPQITPDLFASELFGHKKGAFTDAKEDKQGIMERANGGDVFLDEIADLPLPVQAGILKVIEERIFTRIGETKPCSVDVRFLSSTNSNLIGFRQDLLIRLTEGGTIELPPLRDRKDDIPLLVEKFVRDAEKDGSAMERKIEKETIEVLQRYSWPGNIRELKNCIYNAVQQFSRLRYLVPDHIKLPWSYEQDVHFAMPDTIKHEQMQGLEEAVSVSNDGFVEYTLPQILKDHYKKVLQYLIKALENNKDRRNNEPNYPKTWHAMTGEDLKNSSTCQRNIGHYIFQLTDEEIIKMMKQSKTFSKAVLQCGNKIQSVKKRLSIIKEAIAEV